jgi:FKBP-type peptidyl-prolyl cis-trans isomerase
MRLPIVLGVLAIASTPVWFYHPGGQATAETAAAKTFGEVVPAESITSLRVATWDEATSAAQVLEVKKANGVWSIPSHFDFPADGNTRVTKAAVGFLGVERGRVITTDEKRFEELGVLDPLDPANLTKKGQGKRVTMTDASGKTVVDLIVGKYVEGAQGLYYVREAAGKEVTTAKVDPWELSTKFVDYVETDPFKIAKDDIRSAAIADYSVDEAAGTVVPRSETSFSRTGAGQDWVADGKTTVPADKRVAKTAIDNLVNELNSLRLVGVRPYAKEWLQARGFYLTKEGLYGNEGSLAITTKDGLKYWLFFGEVALDDAADKAAEKPKAEAKADAKSEPKADDKKGNSRYLAVFVQYDEKADEVKAAADKAAAEKAAAAKPEDPKPAEDKKTLSGAKRAELAQKRFSQFFYVISDETFKKLRPALETLFEAKPAEPMAGTTGKTNSVWLEEHSKQPGVTVTASGLQYEVLASGPATGVSPTDAQEVEVKYKGTLIDGAEFDSTKGDATATFGVTGVIKGWTEALKLMKPGDKWKLTIPPALAYGEAGSPPKIGANAILQFEIELLKVK